MKATATASSAKLRIAPCGDVAASASRASESRAWVTASQPRRRPSSGSSNRSINGAQRNLKV
jgi:hypothetical protein